MEQSTKYKRKVQVVFWVSVISSWLTFLFSFSIPFGLLIWVCTLLFLFFKSNNLKWYLLLASSWTLVPFWSFVSGSKDFFQGNATIETFGKPGAEFYNLDPELRAWNATSGCVVMGFEPFTQIPNNLAIKFWTSLFGTQKGVYKGVYPTRDQAKGLISNGEVVKLFKKADTYLISYKNQILSLGSDNYDDLDVLKKTTIAKAFVLNNECLIVESTSDSTQSVILLADRISGKVFARYYEYHSR